MQLGTDFNLDEYPKLKALYESIKTDAKMAKYFASDFYKYSHNNSKFTHFTGLHDSHNDDGPTKSEEVTF